MISSTHQILDMHLFIQWHSFCQYPTITPPHTHINAHIQCFLRLLHFIYVYTYIHINNIWCMQRSSFCLFPYIVTTTRSASYRTPRLCSGPSDETNRREISNKLSSPPPSSSIKQKLIQGIVIIKLCVYLYILYIDIVYLVYNIYEEKTNN